MATKKKKSASTKRGAGPDILGRLREDHKAVKGLLEQLENTTEKAAGKRVRLLEKIAKELQAHTTAEEETFYRSFRRAAEDQEDEEMYYEANEEHHVVDLVLPEILATDPTSPKFGAKAKVLKELVEHHIKEEEREMFKSAREMFEKEQLRDMGDRFYMRKRALLKG